MNVNLGSNKCECNNNSTCQLNYLQNLLIISIADTPEKYVSKVDKQKKQEKDAYISNKFIINIIFLFNTWSV